MADTAGKPRESVALRARNKRQTTTIPTPEVQQYGVFTPGYAGYLQSTAADQSQGSSAALAAANAWALRNEKRNEQEGYAQMLKRAQDLQIEAQRRDVLAEARDAAAGRNIEYMKEGVGGIETVGTDAAGETEFQYHPVQQQTANAYNIGMKRAETIDKMASGFKTLGETGTIPSEEAKSHLLRDPVTGKPMELVQGMNVSDEIDAYTEDTPEDRYLRDTTVAEINQKNNGGVTVEQIFNPSGVSMGLKWTSKAGAAALANAQAEAMAAGIDPKTGRVVRRTTTASPNAGAQGGAAPATSAAEPIRGDLTDYRDAGYDAIENRLERKYGLPQGLMKRIRVFGERTNATGPRSVSPKGARTVYQFTPGTRDHFIKRWKIDPWSSPQAAAESAAIHLSDSIKRGQDPVLEYNAGPKARGAWGSKEAQDYKRRVDSPEAYASVRPSADPNNIRVTRLRALPHVADVSVDDAGIITAKLKNGRVVKYDKGRRVG